MVTLRGFCNHLLIGHCVLLVRVDPTQDSFPKVTDVGLSAAWLHEVHTQLSAYRQYCEDLLP